MRKAVAVPYVIALILGVAVIGLVGYWFVSSGGKFGGQSAKTICDNKFLQWCISTGGSLAAFVESNKECNELVSYNNCDELVGHGAGGGEERERQEEQKKREKQLNEICDDNPADGCNLPGDSICVSGTCQNVFEAGVNTCKCK